MQDNDELIKRYYESKDYFEYYSEQGYFSETEKEVQFIISQTVNGGKVLDIGCGQGRHCIEFAKRGFSVTGIDISKYLLDTARQKSNSLAIKFILSDMREINIKEEFDLIVSLFSSFGQFQNKDNILVLETLAKLIKPEGYFFLDVDNIWRIQQRYLDSQGIYNDRNFTEEIHFDFDTSVVKWTEHHQSHIYNGYYHCYTCIQLINMLSKIGFFTKKLFGSFDGGRYSKNSERLILVSYYK